MNTLKKSVLGVALASAILVALGVSLAGAEPSLKDQLHSARSDAGDLSDRVSGQSTRIASLTQQAHQAGAQAMVVAAQAERTQTRAHGLAVELRAAQAKLERVRAEYATAVKQLEDRLIEMYESDPPDELTVMLNSNGYDDLATRSAYLDALHDADRRVAGR